MNAEETDTIVQAEEESMKAGLVRELFQSRGSGTHHLLTDMGFPLDLIKEKEACYRKPQRQILLHPELSAADFAGEEMGTWLPHILYSRSESQVEQEEESGPSVNADFQSRQFR
ncbi:hypothetical protein P7K49_016986 [Saguinus oedipus]|uniref:Uncharacterized protein n=1 Tax=Saguinus oedipus TaxID=9490 RepID=A0ABQ9V1G0_SAGOE|nr:hypothetical protein P7K49_016986 [Saguinus oedipus]